MRQGASSALAALRLVALALLGLGAAAPAPHVEPPAPQPSAEVQKLLGEANQLLQGKQVVEALSVVERALSAAQDARDPVGEARAQRGRAILFDQSGRTKE